LHNNSKCDDCLNKAKHKSVTEKTETVKSPRGAKAMIGNKFDDLLVIEQIDTDKYLCQCKCGAFKKVRGYSLRHSVANNLGSYVCKHALHIGDTVGKLTVINGQKICNRT
jgi:hypothetical protein